MTDDGRLRCERFETKPKRVIYSPLWADRVGALDAEDIAERFLQLQDCIIQGKIVPPHFYRRGIERTEDELLEAEGIKHAHLDGGGGNAILFVVEYDDAVVFLELDSHRHLETEPVGSVLVSLHASCLRAEDRAAAERVEARIAERGRIFREGLFRRKRTTDAERDEDAPREEDR